MNLFIDSKIFEIIDIIGNLFQFKGLKRILKSYIYKENNKYESINSNY